MPRGRRQRGFALLIVLWALVLLSLLVTRMTAAGRTEARLAANLRGAATLQARADGAVQEAVFHLLAGGTAAWRDDGAVYRPPGEGVEIRIRNLAGRVNPNEARPDLLEALLRQAGANAPAAASLAAAIVTWRFPSARAAASLARYRAAGRAYGPPGRPFRSLDGLADVLGMTPDLLARLRPHVSLYAGPWPDPRYADPVVARVLATLGPPPARSDDSLAARTEEIIATAQGTEGGRFTRRAIVRVGTGQDHTGFEILAWGTPEE